MEENKSTGEGKEETQNQEVAVTTGSELKEEAKEETTLDGAKTVQQMEADQATSARVKNLTSAVILLAGLLVGSLFVDAAQFFSNSGYSERALKNAEIFEGAGKTWVGFTDPIVRAKVLTVSDEKMAECPTCDPTEVVNWLKRFVPTVVADKVDVESAEGKALVKKYGLKSVPAFLFDAKLKDADFYNSEAKMLFEDKDDRFTLNAAQLGVPIGKYLETPAIAEDDPVMGDPEAKVKIVVLSDHECPYCKQFYTTMTKVTKEYGNKVALSYKELPLDFHKRARSAAMAALCANEQGKYWAMADTLFANQQEWSKSEKNDIYKTYAKRLALNSKQFDECIDQSKFDAKIDEDMALGEEYGIAGTPSAFINDQFVGGLVQEADLKKMIEKELGE